MRWAALKIGPGLNASEDDRMRDVALLGMQSCLQQQQDGPAVTG